MSADHHLFAEVETWLQDHRPHLIVKLEEAMSHLTDLIDNGKKLAAERADLITDRDGQKARADAAEAQAASLQAKIDADDKTAADASDALAAEIAKEAGVSSTGTSTSSTDTPVVTTAPSSGATVSTIPTSDGSTTHTALDGTVTTLDHASGSATAVDASGVSVEPQPGAVAEAKDAAADAGVPVQG